MEETLALIPAIILLLVGVVAITLMRRLNLSPIVGYLAAGLMIGPHAFDIVAKSSTTHLLAELGVVFLLFDIGLHFSLSSIWDARRDILGLGPLQIVLCGAAFGGLASLFGLPAEYCLILGGAMALSSTAVVVQTIAERGQQNCPVGRTATAVLIFQDICAIFLFVLASSLSSGMEGGAEPSLALAVGMAILKAGVAFLAAVLIGRFVVKPLFGLLAQTRNEEVFTATALLVVLATSAASGGAGLSLTLGAFLGGMMLADTPYRHVIQTEAKPFRNLLLGFFFITVGMSLDWRLLVDRWAEILAFLVVMVALKIAFIAAAARAFGWSIPGSTQLSFLLAQGSELMFVIIAMPAIRATLGETGVGILITGIAISLALTPTLTELGNRLARRLRQRASTDALVREQTPASETAPVVVFGMDEIGRTVVDAMEDTGVGYVAVEMNYERFLAASADGYPVIFGDLADMRLMETLAIAQRRAVVVTVVRYEVSEALMPIMRERYPNLTRFIAIDTVDDKTRFESLGMHAVVDRSVPRGLDLAAQVAKSMGVDDDKVSEWMQREQERALVAMEAA